MNDDDDYIGRMVVRGKVKLWCKGPVINTFTVLYYVVAILLKRVHCLAYFSIFDSSFYETEDRSIGI